jgi:N-acyl-D-aspartate/D-glutamate deacylase
VSYIVYKTVPEGSMGLDELLVRGGEVLDGRQAAAFGFRHRGVIAPGNVADLTVFALDELHYDPDEFVQDLPGGGSRLRRPDGGYRATFVAGVAVQVDGILTGALPGRAIGSHEGEG